MNAVRLPISPLLYNSSPEYRYRVERLVGLANKFELLVILEERGESETTESHDLDLFWRLAASRFRGNPNVFFAPFSARLAALIRQTGAPQPVIVSAPENAPRIYGQNFIYEVTPHYALMRSVRGSLAAVWLSGVHRSHPYADRS